ncbi:hypothetical protein NPX13_g7769 [Xylaria arbuscula]|uniref:Uncharacterized protein n=1 Tax=Xylaria arbuscula TaxID=114810 RepID=A0A9W8NA96_9PEZI|nr:hypothetical protein NPX13_g7769 [Xylaria arbuscula]
MVPSTRLTLGANGREPRAGQQIGRPEEVEESGSRQRPSSATATWAQLCIPATLHNMFCSLAGTAGLRRGLMQVLLRALLSPVAV